MICLNSWNTKQIYVQSRFCKSEHSVFFLSPEHPPCRADRAAVRLPCRAPVPDVRSAAARQVAARHRNPAVGPARKAAAERPEAAPAEPSSPSGPRRRPAADARPMRPAGSDGASSGSTGR